MPHNISILAIDDDPGTLYTLGQICQYQNWKPLLARSYPEADAVLSDTVPSLILVDYHMPGVDGLSAVARIRKKLPKTPILVLTGDEKASVMERFIDAGANDYALKPIRALDLISRINVHLQFHQKSRFYTDYEKNIAPNTLNIIEDYLKAQSDFVSIDQIVDGTQLKKKTAYRYLQYLIDKNLVETRAIYGGKGRPSVQHKWRT
jgi:two-component system response regulator DctR